MCCAKKGFTSPSLAVQGDCCDQLVWSHPQRGEVDPIQSVPTCSRPAFDEPIPGELEVSKAKGSGFAHLFQYCWEHKQDNTNEISCPKTP